MRIKHYKPMGEAALDLRDAIGGDGVAEVEHLSPKELNTIKAQ